MRYFRTKDITVSGEKYTVLQEARQNDQQQVEWVEIMRIPTESSGGGGGGGSQPGPNTVGSEQIMDGAVEMEDLNQEVIDTMMTENDRVTSTKLEGFDV